LILLVSMSEVIGVWRRCEWSMLMVLHAEGSALAKISSVLPPSRNSFTFKCGSYCRWQSNCHHWHQTD
jgi:hypothetical protein